MHSVERFASAYIFVNGMNFVAILTDHLSLILAVAGLFINLIIIACVLDDLLIEHRKMQYAVDLPTESKKRSHSMAGFVYLMRAATGEFKIGHTKNLSRRKVQLQVQSPVQIELIHAIKYSDRFAAEAKWHQRFASKRIRGEWFQLSDEDVKAFVSVNGNRHN